MSSRKGSTKEQFNPLKCSDDTPITSPPDDPQIEADRTLGDLSATSNHSLDVSSNHSLDVSSNHSLGVSPDQSMVYLNLSSAQFDRFVQVLEMYAMFRNQATDFDAMCGFIATKIGDLSEQEKDLLLKIEYAYITSFKPNASLNVMLRLSNLLKSVEQLKTELESFGLVRDPKQTGNYIKAIDSMTRMLKMASDMQERLFSYAVVEGIINIILDHDDETIKVKVLDYLNKIRYGK